MKDDTWYLSNVSTTGEPVEPFAVIASFECGSCHEVQRRVILDPNRVRCLKCRTTLKITDGILRPRLAKAYPREEP